MFVHKEQLKTSSNQTSDEAAIITERSLIENLI